MCSKIGHTVDFYDCFGGEHVAVQHITILSEVLACMIHMAKDIHSIYQR